MSKTKIEVDVVKDRTDHYWCKPCYEKKLEPKRVFLKMAGHRVFFVPYTERVFTRERVGGTMETVLHKERRFIRCQLCGKDQEGDPFVVRIDL